MIRHRLVLVLLASAVMTFTEAHAGDETTLTPEQAWGSESGAIRIAILAIKPAGVPPAVADSMTQIVTDELGQIGAFRVISMEEIRQMLSFEAEKQALGCDEAGCLAEIGGALGAEYIVGGGVAKLGGTIIYQLQLMQIDTATVAKRLSREVEGDESAIPADLRKSTQLLVQKLLKLKSGFLALACTEEGATVKLDGSIVGVTPLARLELPGGKHELAVEKEGFVVHHEDVTVGDKLDTNLSVHLKPSAEFLREYRSSAKTYRGLGIGFTIGGVALAGAGFALFGFNGRELDELKNDIRDYNQKPHGDAEEHAKLTDRQSELETLDAVYLGLGCVGAAALGLSLYFWIAGDDPDQYDRPTEQEEDAPTVLRLRPVLGPGAVGLRGEF